MKNLLGVALIGSLAVAPAGAQTFSTMCGTSSSSSYPVCVEAMFTLTNSGETLNMYVFNQQTGVAPDDLVQSSIQGLILRLPDDISYLAGSFTASWVNVGAGLPSDSDVTPIWGQTTDGGLNNTIDIDLGAQTTGNQGIGTCAGPTGADGNTQTWQTCERDGAAFGAGWDYMMFSWGLSASMEEAQLATIAWGFRGQRVGIDDNEDSIKCVTDDSMTQSASECDFDTFDTPQEVVPEPATMTLLATGLAGLAAARRRRKNNA